MLDSQKNGFGKPYREVMAERLQTERNSRGMTRKEFAELFGMYPGTYSGIENGNSTCLENCIMIAETLGWTLDYLVGRSDTNADK